MSAETYTYNEEIGTIDSVQFGVYGNKEVKRYSAVNKDLYGINLPESYDNSEPKKGGLIDLRLGPTDNYFDCATCGKDSMGCQGHPGHTELAEPVFHAGFLNTVKNILSCICLRCSKLLVYKNEDELEEMLKNKSGKARFAEIRKLTQNVSYCQRPNYGCGVPIPKIKVEIKKYSATVQIIAETNLTALTTQEGKQIIEGKKKIREILTPENCYDILKNISDTDCRIMGLDPTITRPEDLIIKIFPIPPTAIRPSVKAAFLASTTIEDSLTHKLSDIVKANNRIRKQKDKDIITGEESKYGIDTRHLLQYHVATYYDNDAISLPKSEQKAGGRSTKSVSERIKGKGGRIRGNLMGKRVDFSARTVITSDPNIGIDELGVPLKIAMNLTFPEVVTPYNIGRLTKLVQNGRSKYPGANFVFRTTSIETGRKVKIDLRYRKKSIKLNYGDIVERQLVDGDHVLLNRQPSLHKLSMMAHRIRVIMNPSLATFRLNVSATPPYNADFDGDEMNVFVPQSIQTQVELGFIADVKKQIVTARTSKPIVGLVQDSVLGSYLLSQDEITWREAMNLSMFATNPDHSQITKGKGKKYTGRQLISHIIPDQINIKNKNMNITTGDLVDGVLDKRMLKKIIAYSWDKHGSQKTKDFIDDTQRLIVNWLLMRGFTVGVGDIVLDPDVKEDITKLIEEKKLEVDHLITEIENNPEIMDAEVFEQSIQSDLSVMKGTISKIVMEALDKSNNFRIMVESGSKGKPINAGQSAGALGQDIFTFKRIPKRINNRTLPHFFQNDDSALARGFIEHSYYEGLTPQEFFFHHMTGREGLIDTAIKSVTGDTSVIIIEDGEPKKVQIGDWIDEVLDSDPDSIQHYTEREMELLDITGCNVLIPTTDEKGNVSWEEIKNVTRHLPGKELYKIKTLGGREVIVTESKSLLIWNEEEQIYKHTSTPKVKVGDFVPTTMNLPKPISKSEHILCQSNEEINKYLGRVQDDHSDEIGMLYARLGQPVKYEDGNIVTVDKENLRIQNDTVLDKIVSIETVDIKKYPRVYDVTVPSTLNFCLANGMHVVDTADTGYISRKLVKALEDIMVKYDGTVRNGTNTIVQYLYGDSHIDQTKQKEQKLNIVNLGNDKMKDKFYFSAGEIKEIVKKSGMSKKEVDKLNNVYFKAITNLRDELRVIQRLARLNSITVEDKYMLPINLTRIIADNRRTVDKKDKGEFLSPRHVVEEINRILRPEVTRLVCMTKGQLEDPTSIKHRDSQMFKHLFKTALFEHLAPKRCLYEYKLSKFQFDSIVGEIITNFKKSAVQGGDMVGIVAAQSIGEPSTQMTLNSTVWETNILVQDGTKTIKQPMGELIDELLEERKDDIVVIPENKTEYLELDREITIPTVDENGIVTWEKIDAVTRHLPGGDLIRVKTSSGREVIATTSKSFLVWNDDIEKLVPIPGDKVEVGHRVPITQNLEEPENVTEYLDLSLHLPKTEWVYGSDLLLAKQLYDTGGKGQRGWWKSNNGTTFTVPFKRCDVAMDSLRKKSTVVEGGIVYPLYRNRIVSKIPEFIPMDEEFGFFVGIYLSEGWATDTFVGISNHEDCILKRVKDWCTKYGVTTHTAVSTNKRFAGSKSVDLKIHSVLLARWFKKWMKTGSALKRVPVEAFTASNAFIKGVLDGYFSGDGTVNKRDKYLVMSSASSELIEGISMLCSRFSIFGKISSHQPTKNNVGSKNIRRVHTLSIRNAWATQWAKVISSSHPAKKVLLDKINHKNYGRMYERQIDVILDEIVEVERVRDPLTVSKSENVYDFTVKKTLNFCIANGLGVRDTFHSTGAGVVGMQGVPRIREIISCTKKIKTPMMIIYLDDEFNQDKDTAHRIKANLKYTTLNELANDVEIIYDPDPEGPEGYIKKDGVTNPMFINPGREGSAHVRNLPWLIRATLNKESMIEKDVTMLDLKTKFVTYWNNKYSDTKGLKKNEKSLVTRVSQCAIMSNVDNSPVPTIHIRCNLTDFDMSTFIDLQRLIFNKFTIKGLAKIEDIDKVEKKQTITFDNKNQEAEVMHEYVIYTKGINMIDIRYIHGIDTNRTITNDIYSTYNTLGIEATRALILKELTNVFTSSGNDVNYHHLSLLVDIMTNTGGLTSIDRHGLNKLDTDPFARASFEKTIDQLLNAAVFGEVDHMRSVSSRIMAGRVIAGGTGLCEILLDTDMLENAEYVEELDQPIAKTFKMLTKNALIADVLSKTEFDIFLG